MYLNYFDTFLGLLKLWKFFRINFPTTKSYNNTLGVIPERRNYNSLCCSEAERKEGEVEGVIDKVASAAGYGLSLVMMSV